MQKNVKLYLEAGDIPKSCTECFLGKRYGCVGDVECPLSEIPVRHGTWKVVFHFAPYQKCSSCGFEMPMTAGENTAEIRLYQYCPDCGARMDGGDSHERDQKSEEDVAEAPPLAD